VNVSKHLNHLLKSPFVVHPKTGKVCVPIDPAQADGFDCNAVPVSERGMTGKRARREAMMHTVVVCAWS
jgi:DNA primase catalytic subunit